MAEIEIGTKVKYLYDGQEADGVVHAVRKVDNPDGTQRVIGYLIDTGNDNRVDEIVTPKGKKNIFVRQPEQVDVKPEEII